MTGDNMETKFKTEYIYLLIQKYTRKNDIDYFLVIWQLGYKCDLIVPIFNLGH